MELSKFRQRLQNGVIDFEKKALLQKEYDHFLVSVQKVSWGRLLPLCIILLPALMPVFMSPLLKLKGITSPKSDFKSLKALIFFDCLVVVFGMLDIWLHPPISEDTKKDFEQRIVEPTLKLFDEKLTGHFHADPYDLVDTYMSYPDALVEAHMVREGMTDAKYWGKCSYDWLNPSNTGSFEFLCCEMCYSQNHYVHNAIFKFHTSFTINGTIHIMSTKTEMIFGIEMEKNPFKHIKNKEVVGVNTENHTFNESFDVLATCDEDAYQYLTPLMMETLLALRQRYGHGFSICIKKNVMTVAVNNNKSQFANLTGFHTKKLIDTRSKTLDQHIDHYRHILLSIYELKDRLDPGGRCGMD